MDLHKYVHSVFMVMMCAVLMSTLYIALFGYGSYQGALFYACKGLEYPISRYYYYYCYTPNAHLDEYIDKEQGATISYNINNMYKTESDLSSDNSDNVTFNKSNHYSTGWK